MASVAKEAHGETIAEECMIGEVFGRDSWEVGEYHVIEDLLFF